MRIQCDDVADRIICFVRHIFEGESFVSVWISSILYYSHTANVFHHKEFSILNQQFICTLRRCIVLLSQPVTRRGNINITKKVAARTRAAVWSGTKDVQTIGTKPRRQIIIIFNYFLLFLPSGLLAECAVELSEFSLFRPSCEYCCHRCRQCAAYGHY